MMIMYAVNAIVMASWGVGCNFTSFLDKLHLVVWLGKETLARRVLGEWTSGGICIVCVMSLWNLVSDVCVHEYSVRT